MSHIATLSVLVSFGEKGLVPMIGAHLSLLGVVILISTFSNSTILFVIN